MLDPQTILTEAAEAATITHRTCAALCCAFYKNFDSGQLHAAFPAGWVELKRVSAVGGYDGVALHHPASRTLVIVNRGTETSADDWWQNIGSALTGAPGRQIWDAQRLVVDASGLAAQSGLAVDRVLFTGHSLGGALTEAQALLSPSLLPSGLTGRVEAVGVASAGFGPAVKAFAKAYGMTLHDDPAAVVTHYVRKEDVVTRHPRRRVYGREVRVASIYETRTTTAHKRPTPRWTRICDLLENHSVGQYLTFFDEPGEDRHIWRSHRTGLCEARDGVRPGWKHRNSRPADW